MWDPDRFLLVVLVGVGTGILSGMFGVGGAIVSTPAIRALGANALDAVGSTLPSVIPSAISGTLRYARERLIRWDVFGWTAGAGVLASIGGALATAVIPGDGHPLMLATATLVAFTAYRLGRTPPAAAPSPAPPATPGLDAPLDTPLGEPLDPPIGGPGAATTRVTTGRCIAVGVAAGGLSGLLGIGGGILMVPAFVGWLRLPLKSALGTSLACVGVLAVPGTATHALIGHVDWAYALALSIGVVPGAQLGAHLAIRATDRVLRWTVSGALGLVAVAYFVGELVALIGG